MGAALNMASASNAYVLSDRGTWLALHRRWAWRNRAASLADPRGSGQGIVTAQTCIGKRPTDFRNGSQADILGGLRDVRFTLESGHPSHASPCLLWAIFGLMHRSKLRRCSITSSARASTHRGKARRR